MSEAPCGSTIQPRLMQWIKTLHPLTKRLLGCAVGGVLMGTLVIIVAIYDGYSVEYAAQNGVGWFFIVLVGLGSGFIMTYPLSEEYAERFVEAQENE